MRSLLRWWLASIGLIAALTLVARGEENAAPRWWKGNLHTHSLWSDGNDFPEMVAEWYRTHDYHFLSITDHNTLSEGERWISSAELEKRSGREGLEKYLARFGKDWVEQRRGDAAGAYDVRLKPLDEFRGLVEQRGRFLLIPGEEISDNDAKHRGAVHVNVINPCAALSPTGIHQVREAIEANLRAAEEQAKRAGREMLVQLNHPNFVWAITAEDMTGVGPLKLFEVYNGHPNVHNRGDDRRAGTEEIWDIANTLRISEFRLPPLLATATDDSHHYHKFGDTRCRPGRGWIMVKAAYLTTESLIRAIHQGNFYASTGVTLNEVNFDFKTQELRLDIDAHKGVEYMTRFIGTLENYDRGSQERVSSSGKPLRTTRQYSSDIGKVLATVTGTRPSYRLKGNELYVRAVVTSTAPASRSAIAGELEQAWTQPVGWQQRLETR
jgi:hypothetical protein